MLRRALTVGVLVLVSACQVNPKQTVLNLDTTDRKWSSRECVSHRKAAADYNDGERTRAMLGLADYAVPFAGTATSLLMSWRKDPMRAELNERIRRACVSQNNKHLSAKPTGRPYAGGGRRGGRNTYAE